MEAQQPGLLCGKQSLTYFHKQRTHDTNKWFFPMKKPPGEFRKKSFAAGPIFDLYTSLRYQ